ncbi:MAG: ATP-binding protein [bacterium]
MGSNKHNRFWIVIFYWLCILLFLTTAQVAFSQSYCLRFGPECDDYVTVPNSPDFFFEGEYTIECWFSIHGTHVNDQIPLISTFQADHRSYSGWLLGIREPSKESGPTRINTSYFDDFYTLDVLFHSEFDRWYHLAVSSDGEIVRLFLNGELLVKAPTKIKEHSNQEPLTIGGQNGDWWNRNLNGMIDEVRISNTCRYTEQFTPSDYFHNDEYVLAIYHMDEGEGNILHDTSGRNHHGIIDGAEWVKLSSSNEYPFQHRQPQKQPVQPNYYWIIVPVAFLFVGLILLVFQWERIRAYRSFRRFPVSLINSKGKVIWSSQYWKELLSSESLSIEQSDDFRSALAELSRSYLTGSLKHEIFDFQIPDAFKVISLTAFPFRSFWGKRKVMVIAKDVTSEAQMKQTASWVYLAQRLAHSIKTPLSTILMSLERIQMEYQEKLSPDDHQKADSYVAGATAEIKRLRDASKAFMNFLKIEQPQFVVKESEDYLTKFLGKYQSRIDAGITLEKEFEQGIYFSIDPTLLDVVMENLLENSQKSMDGKGILRIASYQKEEVSPQTQKIEEKVIIEIEDTGCGMSEELVKNIFNPYFSNTDGGTGLGLFVSRRIIEDHGGTIRIESKLDRGTKVFIEISAVKSGDNHE